MNSRPVRKLLHFFDRKHLLQRRFQRFLALEKTHDVFRRYAALIDLLVSGRRLAGSAKALLKVTVQNTELDRFGFVVRRARNQDQRPPLQQLYDLLRHEGQWLRVQPQDGESGIRNAVNAVLDARSYHVSLHKTPVFPAEWDGGQILKAIEAAELQPAGFSFVALEGADAGFSGTILRTDAAGRVKDLLSQLHS